MRLIFYHHHDLYGSYAEDEKPVAEKFVMHTHFHTELFYFISGDAVYHVEGSAYPLQPGDILLIRPAEAHYVELLSPAPYKRIVYNFDTDLLTPLDPEQRLMRPYLDRESGKGNLYRKSDFKDCDPEIFIKMLYDNRENRLGTIAALILLLSAINRVFENAPPSHAHTDTVEFRLLRYINNNLSENITLEKLCNKYFISRAQLCRRFKKTTGTSLGRYITAKRLVVARSMLLEGKKPTEIFNYCGFVDYSTFYRAYTKYYGHSPKDEIFGDMDIPYCQLIE